MKKNNSPDSAFFIWSWENTIEKWLLENPDRINTDASRGQSIGGALLCGNERLLYWSDTDQDMKLYKIGNGHLIQSLTGHQAGVRGALILNNGNIVSWSWDDTVRIWHGSTGKPIAVCEHFEVEGVSALDNERFASWSYWDYGIRIWDSRTGIMKAEMGHFGRVLMIAASKVCSMPTYTWNYQRSK